MKIFKRAGCEGGGYGSSSLCKWVYHFKIPAENLRLIGRLVSAELIDMDRPNVSEAFRNVSLKLRFARR
jgi:hypothetical protein